MSLNYHFQKLLFLEEIIIDANNRTYRTSNLNPTFRLIHSFTGGNDSGNKKRTGINTDPSCLVDNSFEISNISFSPRNFELAIQSIQFIQSILYSIIFSTTS